MKVAILLTCHNRRNKTKNCLISLFNAELPENYIFNVFLVDDGSSDGTTDIIKKKFPTVNVIKGTGNLFWAGGMRLAWEAALKNDQYDAYLLVNDDVILKNGFFLNFIETDKYVIKKTGKSGIYSGCTVDKNTKKVTYSGNRILKKGFIIKTEKILSSDTPQECDMANANILWVSNNVVKAMGILDKKFIHGIADFDYTLRAKKNGFPVFISLGIGGYCTNEHGVNWKSSKSTMKERINYLKSPTGLQYNEYLYYIKRNFPLNLPYAFIMLWLKTLFPFLWDKFK